MLSPLTLGRSCPTVTPAIRQVSRAQSWSDQAKPSRPAPACSNSARSESQSVPSDLRAVISRAESKLEAVKEDTRRHEQDIRYWLGKLARQRADPDFIDDDDESEQLYDNDYDEQIWDESSSAYIPLWPDTTYQPEAGYAVAATAEHDHQHQPAQMAPSRQPWVSGRPLANLIVVVGIWGSWRTELCIP